MGSEPLMGPDAAPSGNMPKPAYAPGDEPGTAAETHVTHCPVRWNSKAGVQLRPEEEWKLKAFKRANPGLFPGDPDLET